MECEQTIGQSQTTERMLYVNGLQIIGFVETHLYDDQTLDLPGYTWFGQNRVKHINAKKGSESIGFYVKNNLVDNIKVEILDNHSEGILWI